MVHQSVSTPDIEYTLGEGLSLALAAREQFERQLTGVIPQAYQDGFISQKMVNL